MSLILCSMGGAVCADMLQKNLVKDIMGCVVLDVVEGTAIEALSHMNTILVRFHFSFLGFSYFPSLPLTSNIHYRLQGQNHFRLLMKPLIGRFTLGKSGIERQLQSPYPLKSTK